MIDVKNLNLSKVKKYTKHLYIAGRKLAERDESRQKLALQMEKVKEVSSLKNISRPVVENEFAKFNELLSELIEKERIIIELRKGDAKKTEKMQDRINELEHDVDAKAAKNYMTLTKIEDMLSNIRKKMEHQEQERLKRQQRLESLENRIKSGLDSKGKELKFIADKLKKLEETYHLLRNKGYSEKELGNIKTKIHSSRDELARLGTARVEHGKLVFAATPNQLKNDNKDLIKPLAKKEKESRKKETNQKKAPAKKPAAKSPLKKKAAAKKRPNKPKK